MFMLKTCFLRAKLSLLQMDTLDRNLNFCKGYTRESCYGLGLRLITPWLMRNYTYLGSNTGRFKLIF